MRLVPLYWPHLPDIKYFAGESLQSGLNFGKMLPHVETQFTEESWDYGQDCGVV